jgi:hypothetical protein
MFNPLSIVELSILVVGIIKIVFVNFERLHISTLDQVIKTPDV